MQPETLSAASAPRPLQRTRIRPASCHRERKDQPLTHDGVVSYPQRRSLVSRMFGREPDPNRPLDDDYVQRKWVRLYRPGPWRTAVIVPTVLVLAFLTAVAMVAALSVPGSLAGRAFGLLVMAAFVAVLGTITARVMTVGVYVNDAAIRLLTLRSTRVVPWSRVVDVRRVPGPQPLLGMPWLPRHGERVLLVLADGSDLPTPVTTMSPDFAGRAEAYDVSALALERWWHDSRV